MDPLQALIAGFIVGWVLGVGTRLAADRRQQQRQPFHSVAMIDDMLTGEKYREDVVKLYDGELMHVRMEEN